MSFLDRWKSDIWPVVKSKYDDLLKCRPAKQETATGSHYGDKVYEILASKKEVRNIACNLAWTDPNPIQNTVLQSAISLATVERFALDMYVDTSVAGSAAAVAGSAAVETAVAGSAAMSGGDNVGEGDSMQHAAKVLLQSPKKAWKIPKRVPRGYEIQIAVVTTATEPPKGSFRRLGLDVVVNATWLAMKWALESKDQVAEAALTNLILDWPFDFVLFEQAGAAAEVQIMKHIINMPAQTERLRDFCGLDQGNLMRIAAEVRKLIERQTPAKVTVSVDEVHAWMKNPDNIRWGFHHVPSLRTVKDLLRNWDTVNKMPEVLTILDRARCEFGRDSLFESVTKLNCILMKGQQNPALITYIMEAVYTVMLRKKAKNPFSLLELQDKGGTVDILLWQRRYLAHLLQDYSGMFTVAESVAKPLMTLREVVMSPLAMYELTLGESRDVTFAQALPNEALRLFFKHAQEVLTGYYTAELKGALTSTSQYSFAKFQESDRVKRRFFDEFVTAYDAVTIKHVAVVASAAQVAESAAKQEEEEKPEPEPLKAKKVDRQARLAEFRREAETRVSTEIDARMVVLTQDGSHQEMSAQLSSTRLYQNLTESVRFMAFYDVKNAKLMERRPGETVVQREPLVDMGKFAAFCDVVNNVLKPGQDFVWILAGKSDANVDRIRKKVLECGWKEKAVHLVYDWKAYQKWYVKKMRGMANSRTYEKAFICWKGKFPSGLPKDRQYVDVGSALYVDTIMKVPILHPKDQTWVEQSVLSESLKTMGGLSDDFGFDGFDDPDVADSAALVAESAAAMAESVANLRPLQDHVKKRRLYRSTTEESVVWFPHDNHPDLLREFVWESGSPRWVLHGTPASGAGVLGCLEAGVSVIALCENAHHQKHLDIALRERAVEAMLVGSRIFKDEALQAKALEFCPTGTGIKKDKPPQDDPPKKDDESEPEDSDSGDSAKKNKDKRKKKKKNKKAKKGKKKDGKKKRKSPEDPESTDVSDSCPSSSGS